MRNLRDRQREIAQRQGLPERGTPEWEKAWQDYYKRADVKEAQEKARLELGTETANTEDAA